MSEKVVEFAKKQGYKTAEFVTKWKGYDVYEPVFSDELSYIGLPLWILVKGSEIRMTDEKECFEILDIVGDEQEVFEEYFDKLTKKKRKKYKLSEDELKDSAWERIRGFFVKGFNSSPKKELVLDMVDKDGREHNPYNGEFCQKGTTFRYNISKLLRGEYNGPNELEVVRSLGNVWNVAGLQNLPLFFHKKKIMTVMKEHDITEQELSELPSLISYPEMIFKSKTDERSFVAILKNTLSPLIAVVLPLQNDDKARSIIKSFYWKDKDFIKREKEAKRLLYKKSEMTADDASIALSLITSDENINKKYYLYLFRDV